MLASKVQSVLLKTFQTKVKWLKQQESIVQESLVAQGSGGPENLMVRLRSIQLSI